MDVGFVIKDVHIKLNDTNTALINVYPGILGALLYVLRICIHKKDNELY